MAAHHRYSILSMVLVALLLSTTLLLLMPGNAVALQDGDFEYELVGDPAVAAVTRYTGAGGAVSVPSTLGGYPTAIISHDAFNNMQGDLMTSVLLPSSVLSVENYAFANCDLLSAVSISSGVTFIGDQVFHNCHSLEYVNVKDSNTRYSSIDGVLYDKDQTTLIKCPAAKTGEVVVPNSVTSMVWRAFDHCWSLQHLTIGSGIASLDSYVLYECKALETLTFVPGGHLGSIGAQAFARCASLQAVELPEGLRTIGDSAFIDCVSLYILEISEGVEIIGRSAFQGCVSLTNVSIPASVTSIASDAFYRCTNLAALEVSEGNTNYSSIDGVLYNKNASLLIQCPAGRSGAFAVPSSVMEIGENAFAMNQGLTEVTMGAGVRVVGEHSFMECTNLTEITLGPGVVTIGAMAFANCASLAYIVIPAAVDEVGSLAFFGCQSLTNITFLGLRSPELVGYDWVGSTNPMLRGHADSDSDFPVPGSTFYGLTMGPNVETAEAGATEDGFDNTTLLLLGIAALLAMIVSLLVIMIRWKRRGP